MSGSFGKKINISIFGESHGDGIGIVINGIPSGIKIDMDKIMVDMDRRSPGKNQFSTQRDEKDIPNILSGIFNGYTTGTPIAMMMTNGDQHSKDYKKTKDIIRPSHADYTGFVKYNGFNDYRGGGHFSGRITSPLVFAGAIAKQVLEQQNIFIGAHIKQIGNVEDDFFTDESLNKDAFDEMVTEVFPIINKSIKDDMEKEVMSYKEKLDSIGGIVEVGIIGMPVGVGNPYFDSIESIISHLVFSVPGVKGIEFGLGFEFASKSGGLANDEFYIDNDTVKTKTNNNGGINGGISNGMPIIYRAVLKPTPSIGKKQNSVDISKMENAELNIVGRHDPTIVHRALVVLEAATAIAILELL